jgi:hypothetical protein
MLNSPMAGKMRALQQTRTDRAATSFHFQVQQVIVEFVLLLGFGGL